MIEQSAFQSLDDQIPPRISTGSAGLDNILGGGFDSNRMYLYEGRPGTGKTTIALQFLLEGARRGERVLYVTLSETRQELHLVAKRHGWSLDGIDIFELVPPESSLDPGREQTIFHPAEIELGETTKLVFERITALNPSRVVFDSLSELRLLAQNQLRYRRQVLALKHFFASRQCTVVLLDDLSSSDSDLQLHSISHGVVLLEQLAIEYGAERRRLRIVKMRGIEFSGGFHDFTIKKGGLEIYPRLVAAEHHAQFVGEFAFSGNVEIDALLGGGLERGTNALLIGAAGVGKSSLALSYVIAAAQRGEHAMFFAFDEGRGTLEARAKTLGLPLESALESGLITLRQIDPAELSPGEFASIVRRAVEIDNARVIVIDSLNGYLNAMPDGRFLILQMHELLTYLGQQGVLTLLVLAQHGLVGPMVTPLDISYLSDAVIMLRYFEFRGTVRRAMSVVKKRSGNHEHTIREFALTPNGIALGPPLKDFNGVFSHHHQRREHAFATGHGVTGDYVCLSISDSGTGMSREVQEHVFEPFFTTKEVGKGSGLGLALVYGFAKQSGGSVQIESEIGRGTCVTLFLPRTTKTASVEIPCSTVESSKAGTENALGSVLLVEDNDEVGALVTEMLHELGYDVTRAASAAAALGALADHRDIDIVFSDIVMPGGMDGLALVREIRERRPNLPVLLTSGYAEALKRTTEHHVVLRKPYRIHDLATAIEATLSGVRDTLHRTGDQPLANAAGRAQQA